MHARHRRALLAACLLPLVLSALPAGAAPAAEGFSASIVRTDHGIPHVTGEDLGDIGYGFGYAHAEDNLCTLAEVYVTVNGERSKWFGPDATWRMRGNGTVNTNRHSDVFYRGVIASRLVEDLLAQPPPHGPLPGVRETVRGYVAGYNRYLRDIGGPDGISDPRCAGAGWVRPISEMDAYLRFFQLAGLASSQIAIDEIGSATPPPGLPGAGGGAVGPVDRVSGLEDALAPGWLGIGSNAYGLGKDVTDNGKGLVLGNPHFPWHGGERLYQWHATIPGELDVAGASLYGVPVVLIGHTAGVAWSHTVSTAFRFTPFELTLQPGSPTTYLVDGQPEEMEAIEVTIDVKQDDGSITAETGTVYRTRYGWVATGIVGVPLFPWTPAKAWALGDVNEHMRYLNHFFEINQAQSTLEVEDILERYLGIPWVNTIAADRDGRAYYADIGAIPNVPDEHVRDCASVEGQATFAALRLPIMDGSRSDCGWLTDADAVAPGIFGPGNLPELSRDDYVTNSNDSHWLTNPEEPITGYDRIIGDEGTERTLRTRLGLRIVADRLEGTDGYTGDRWTQDILQDAVFNNRQFAAELTRDAAVGMCRAFPGGQAPSSDGPVSVEQDGVSACDVLAGWDLRDDVGSVGALLFRRFWTHADDASGSPWVNRFDRDQPVATPNTLNTVHPEVQQAFGDGIQDLLDAGIPLDAPLGEFQYEDRDAAPTYPDELEVTDPIPIHGGPGSLGVFNAINVAWDPRAGYTDVPHGSSFVMVAQFVDGDCPVDADAVVTYSQSEDPTSPWFADQTRNYSEKIWNDMPFCADEIAEATLATTTVSEPDTVAAGHEPTPVAAPDPAADALADTGGGLLAPAVALLAVGALGRRRRRG